ncbi:Translation initiation factor IF-2, mitochondrial [Armadillidium nasatum]|uniref:Translation initiation factor IF-2, mitochondrial n=1 Tax=Armadillidium nasatum TaxID=96803 RepID=A0A5N5SVM3_9CRUS|nr:Translation initiation factor IF-2, mitochondrial [Armadillidium nasatum]
MRARGANVTDIIVLVVAAEDGAMQQTKESADLAHESGTPIIVAINKIDKPDADIKKCEESLISIGIQPESMGGDVQVVPISALKGTNISLLVESLVTQAELLELKETVKGKSEGTVIESEVRPEGKVATCIIRRGTLKRGCVIVADTAWGKVRNMFNSQGSPVTKALPGTPVQVTGWRNRIPPAGAEFLEVDSEKRAKEVVSFREDKYQKIKDEKALKEIEQKREEHLQHYQEYREKKLELGFRRKMRRTTPLEKQFKEDTHPRLCIVLKGDVDGSVDAILNILDSYQSEECSLELLNFGVGSITPNDIDLAKSFNGIIYTFNLPNITADVKYLLNENKVPVHQHNIIYRLIEDLQDEISKRLPPLPVEEIIGEAVVNEEFLVSEGKSKVPVAGCRCLSGFLKKSELFRVIRSTDTIFDGELESLKHVKKEVETIKKDVDCGLMLKEKSIRFHPGDKILCYHLKMVNRRTDWNPTGF